jgi:predicted DNA binding CopG/RHH family protein
MCYNGVKEVNVMNKMKQLHIRMTEDQLNRVNKLAAKKEMSASEYVRQLILADEKAKSKDSEEFEQVNIDIN